MEGFLPDGTTLRSNPFTYRIKVCNGCLAFNPGVDCTILDEQIDGPCLIGQDEGVDCRVCFSVFRDLQRCDPTIP